MKKNKILFGLLLICGIFFSTAQEIPVKFLSHKVKKKETIFGITRKYNVTAEQLNEYNPLLKKVGLRKRMMLRIPVYPKIVEKVTPPPQVDQRTQSYIVKSKETKWRIAYNFQITIPQLEVLNPKIKKGLKEGQEIHVPRIQIQTESRTESLTVIQSETQTETNTLDSTWDSTYNYYKVLPKEGYYRIEKKIGVTKRVLDSLNPKLHEEGLQVGMILRVPGDARGELKIQDDLLVERLSLLDSIKEAKEIELAILLPFKSKEIEYDSIEDMKRLLQSRNLHTLSADFYSGVLLAADTLSHYGISVKLNVFDTQNSIAKVNEIVNTHDFSKTDAIVGPLIPSNFDYLSTKLQVRKIPKVAPLSTNSVALREAVYQSVTSKKFLRKRMYEYLDNTLNREDNIVLVVDSLNRSVEKELLELFPKATVLRPEKSNYLLPDLVDSLLVDSLPNKVILESQAFSLISSASSQMSAQQSALRSVQLFTTYRSNVYENTNLSLKQFGDLKFTYTTDRLPLKLGEYNSFQNHYISLFGKPPNRTAIRAYDLTMDLILRKAYSGNLKSIEKIGETDYQEHRFLYSKQNKSFQNTGYFLLQHNDYEIVELKK
ncbi:MAG: LysM peptidoglycan-binding domain-containing protein [Flavobacteriaceae bacterium]|nr:LysM peptidoglycan-binding domain-containing protein [Flavobacteriaceae bacterium]MDG1965910.1 LysM peptidoglycan-binding domain-containing protein [Flavobacteriaceae bacterium]